MLVNSVGSTSSILSDEVFLCEKKEEIFNPSFKINSFGFTL